MEHWKKIAVAGAGLSAVYWVMSLFADHEHKEDETPCTCWVPASGLVGARGPDRASRLRPAHAHAGQGDAVEERLPHAGLGLPPPVQAGQGRCSVSARLRRCGGLNERILAVGLDAPSALSPPLVAVSVPGPLPDY